MPFIDSSHTIRIKADIIESAAQVWPELMESETVLRGSTNVSAAEVFTIYLRPMPGKVDNLEVNITLRDRRYGEPLLSVTTGQHRDIKEALMALKRGCRALVKPRSRLMKQVTKSEPSPMDLPAPDFILASTKTYGLSPEPPLPPVPPQHSTYNSYFQEVLEAEKRRHDKFRERWRGTLPTTSSLPNLHHQDQHDRSSDFAPITREPVHRVDSAHPTETGESDPALKRSSKMISYPQPTPHDVFSDKHPQSPQDPPTAASKRSRARRQPSGQHPYSRDLQQSATMGNLHAAQRPRNRFERLHVPMPSRSQEDFTVVPRAAQQEQRPRNRFERLHVPMPSRSQEDFTVVPRAAVATAPAASASASAIEQSFSEQEHRERLLEELRDVPRPTALLPPSPFAPRGGDEVQHREVKRWGIIGNVPQAR